MDSNEKPEDSDSEDWRGAWLALIEQVKQEQERRAELGLPLLGSLRHDSEAWSYNAFGSLAGTLSPEGCEGIDLSGELARGVGFTSHSAACILLPLTPTRSELLLVVPSYGSEDAASRLDQALVFAFGYAGVEEIHARCAADTPHAGQVLMDLGFRFLYSRSAAPVGRAETVCEFYSLSLDDWIRHSPELPPLGSAAGAEWADPLDALQMRYVGFLQAAYTYNNLQRGIDVYNRWALLAGLGAISALPTAAPPVLLEPQSEARH